MVNKPVKSAEFEFEKIGLRSGDYIVIAGDAKEVKYYWLAGTTTNQIIASKDELLKKVKVEATGRKIKRCPLPENN